LLGAGLFGEIEMRTVLVVVFLGLMGSAAEASCHKYSRWYYPFPQRCRIVQAAYEVPIKAPPLPPIPDSPDYEIPLPDLAGVWEPLEDYKELKEGLERKKALILLLTR
jgi:hypothetical protein